MTPRDKPKGKGRERERERETPISCLPNMPYAPTGDRTYKLGRYSDQESYPQPFGVQDDAHPPDPPSQCWAATFEMLE